ncbi:MAG: winged helix-turn-helix domain-containing protein [Sciscionella sp.]
MSPSAARRTALAAQGFADPPPNGAPSRRHLGRVLDRVRLLQLDSVNVAVRAHYMPVFSRLGRYPPELLDEAAWLHSPRRPRLFAEYWAHEASLIPIADWPLLRWRMRRLESRYAARVGSIAPRSVELSEKVLTAVEELGPIGAGELERVLDVTTSRPKGGWWNRSEVKWLCEWLFAAGRLTTGTRVGFQRLYDLPERVLGSEVVAARVEDATAFRELVARSAAALGVATEPDLRDYYRLPPADSQRAVAELVEEGTLEPVEVRGWRQQGYRHATARTPRRIGSRALLCPFDPLIWARDRTERMFGFRYRIEIYVPEAKRVNGYYVFPFLLGDALVGRVDLKTDRGAGVLRVRGAFAEPDVERGQVAEELAAELWSMAGWLGCAGVRVEGRGDLAFELRSRVAAGPA